LRQASATAAAWPARRRRRRRGARRRAHLLVSRVSRFNNWPGNRCSAARAGVNRCGRRSFAMRVNLARARALRGEHVFGFCTGGLLAGPHAPRATTTGVSEQPRIMGSRPKSWEEAGKKGRLPPPPVRRSLAPPRLD
jgi:hypothetical protein